MANITANYGDALLYQAWVSVPLRGKYRGKLEHGEITEFNCKELVSVPLRGKYRGKYLGTKLNKKTNVVRFRPLAG